MKTLKQILTEENAYSIIKSFFSTYSDLKGLEAKEIEKALSNIGLSISTVIKDPNALISALLKSSETEVHKWNIVGGGDSLEPKTLVAGKVRIPWLTQNAAKAIIAQANSMMRAD